MPAVRTATASKAVAETAGAPCWRKLAGGLISDNKRAVFSADNRHVFTIRGCDVAVFAVATGDEVALLKGHTKAVTSVFTNPRNKLQLVSASLDGTVKIWDYRDAELLKTIGCGTPVLHALTCPAQDDAFYWISMGAKEGARKIYTKVHRKSLAPPSASSATGESGEAAPVESLNTSRYHGICNNWRAEAQGSYLCATDDHYLLIFWLNGQQQEGKRKGHPTRFANENDFTCMSTHPTEPCIATGDAQGKITIWRNVLLGQPPVKTSFHWHAHGVGGLSFNSDGAYLISGGEEAVLVVWQVTTGNQRFLSRLGAPIQGVAVCDDDTLYLTVQKDNSIKIVDVASFEVERVVNGIKHAPTGHPAKALRFGMLAGVGQDTVVLNGSLGCVQVYNIARDKLELEHTVVDRTFISRTRGKQIAETTIDGVAFTKDGCWMATVESRDDEITSLDVRLKFWQECDGEGERFSLITSVDPVHRSEVSAIVAHPTKYMFVTSSLDRRFKTWAFQPASDTGKATWYCLYVGAYLDLPIISVDFSFDGSLLAVTAGKYVTLWNPMSSEMLRVLPTPGSESLRGSLFTASHYLVAFSGSHLTVWNLLSCTVRWRIRLEVESVSVNPFGPSFMALIRTEDAQRQVIIEFDPESAAPVATHSIDSGTVVCALAYVPLDSAAKTTRLCILDSDLVVSERSIQGEERTDAADAKKDAIGKAAAKNAELQEDRAGFSRVFGSARPPVGGPSDAMDDSDDDSARPSDGSADPSDALFSQPSHVLPPMSTLVSQFLNTVLAKAPDASTADAQGGTGAADSDSDDDDNEDDADADVDIDAEPAAEVTRVVLPAAERPGAEELAAAKPQQFDFMVRLWSKSSRKQSDVG